MALYVYNSAAFSTASGVAVAGGATVSVRLASSGALAALYSNRDAAGSPGMANPFTADSSGRFTFYAALVEQGYSVRVQFGAEDFTVNNVLDLDDFNRLTVWAEQFGAVGNGLTDDAAEIQAALNAGGRVNLADRTYICGSAITVPDGAELVGSGKQSTILKFTGATNGLVISGTLASVRIADLQIQTSHASAQRSIYFTGSGATRCLIQNVEVSVTGSGRWTHGFWASAFQTSEVRSLRIYQAATVGIHLEFGCNAVNWYNIEIVGTTGAGTITKGWEISDGGSPSSSFEFNVFGGTVQGYFTHSLIHSVGCSPKFYGMHIENTNTGSPTVTDIQLEGTSVNASFVGFQGGSISTSGIVRNLQISHSELVNVTFNVLCNFATMFACRLAALTDNGSGNLVIGCSDSAGNQGTFNTLVVPERVVVPFGSPSIISIDALEGSTFDVIATNTGAFTISNPVSGVDNQRITIRVYNNTGGTMGTITWGGDYKMSTWTNPANGFYRSVDFMYESTHWLQVGQTGTDINF